LGWTIEQSKEIEQGGLTRTGRPHDGEEIALAHGEVGGVQGMDGNWTRICLGYAGKPDNGLHGIIKSYSTVCMVPP
jgi:hypothetical protein